MSCKLSRLTPLLFGFLMVCGSALAKGPDPCLSSATILDQNSLPVEGTGTWLSCPQGDGAHFSEVTGWGAGLFHIRIECIDSSGPWPGILASDFWLIDCDPLADLSLCGGAASSNADSVANSQGITTMSATTLAAGGCADGLAVVVMGFVLLDPNTGCTTAACLSVNVRSPDIDADGRVDLPDMAVFAAAYPPGPYGTCSDFDGNGIVDLVDLSVFADHFGPPGHACSP